MAVLCRLADLDSPHLAGMLERNGLINLNRSLQGNMYLGELNIGKLCRLYITPSHENSN